MSVVNFVKQIMDRDIPVHSFIIYRAGEVIGRSDLFAGRLHRMFSIAKSIVAIDIGLLLSEGKLRLEDRIISYFPEYLPDRLPEYLEELTIRDMLMMRGCYFYNTYKAGGKINWVESFFKSRPDHRGGEFFYYDTAAAHVLGALAEKLSGLSLMDYFRKRLEGIMGEAAYMLKDPQGVSFGGSGLMADQEDLLRLGIFFLEAHTLSPEAFCEKYKVNECFREYILTACSNLTSTALEGKSRFESFGYGYYIWQCDKNGFMCYGMGGQLLAVYPKKKLILVTTADTQGIANGIDEIFDAFYENIYDEAELSYEECRLYLKPVGQWNHIKAIGNTEETAKIFEVNTNIRLKDSGGYFEELRFKGSEDGRTAFITFKYKDGRSCSIGFGFENFYRGQLDNYGYEYMAGAAFTGAGELFIKLYIIDTSLGNAGFRIYFDEKGAFRAIYMQKKAENELDEFSGYMEAEDGENEA